MGDNLKNKGDKIKNKGDSFSYLPYFSICKSFRLQEFTNYFCDTPSMLGRNRYLNESVSNLISMLGEMRSYNILYTASRMGIFTW